MFRAPAPCRCITRSSRSLQADGAGPRSGSRRWKATRPSSAFSSVDLPAPLGPITVTTLPLAALQVQAVQHLGAAVAGVQVLHIQQGIVWAHVSCSTALRATRDALTDRRPSTVRCRAVADVRVSSACWVCGFAGGLAGVLALRAGRVVCRLQQPAGFRPAGDLLSFAGTNESRQSKVPECPALNWLSLVAVLPILAVADGPVEARAVLTEVDTLLLVGGVSTECDLKGSTEDARVIARRRPAARVSVRDLRKHSRFGACPASSNCSGPRCALLAPRPVHPPPRESRETPHR